MVPHDHRPSDARQQPTGPVPPAMVAPPAEAASEELRRLQAITDTALVHLQLEDLLDALLDRILAVMGVEDVAILLLDEDSQQLTLRAARGLEDAVVAQATVPVGQGFAGRIAASRALLIVDDLSTFDVFHAQLRETQRSAIGVPLLVEDRLLGVLYVGSAVPRHFTEQEAGLLQRAADRIALAIDRAQLFEAEQTARREAERERVRWQAAMDSVPELVITCDADLRRNYVNPAYERLRGGPADLSVPVEELPARHGLYLPNGTDLFPVEQLSLTRAVREGRPVHESEMVIRNPDGEPRLVVWETAPMRSTEGELLGAVAIGHDITERKQLERALQASEARYRDLVETQTELICRYLPDTTLTFVNEAFCRSYGRPREELLGRRFLDLLDESMRAHHVEYIAALLAHPHIAVDEHEDVLADGSSSWQQWVDHPIFDAEGHLVEIQSVGRDITERKRLEREREAARAEAERQAAQLDRLFEQMADGVTICDAQGRIARENAAARAILGLDAAPPDYYQLTVDEQTALFAARDAQGRPLAWEDAPSVRALRGEVLTGADAMDLQVRTLDGREVDLNVSAAPLRDREGRIVGAVRVLRDQTERKRLEREHAEQAAQLDRIFEGMTDALIVYNAQGQLVRANPAARRLLGLDAAPPDYAQLPLRERVALYAVRDEQGRLLAPEETPLLRTLAGETLTGAGAIDGRMRTLEGRDVELNVSGAPLRDREGRVVGAVGILRDQTERKQLEREREAARASELALREVNRHMERFLATASHDLRTPVTGIVLGVDLAQRRLQQLAATAPPSLPPTGDPPTDQQNPIRAALAALERASGAAQRLSRLIVRLFDVAQARTGTLELKVAPCDLAALVHAEVAAQRALAPERTIRLDLDPDAAVPVVADGDRLGQVLANYLANALKYSPEDQPVEVSLAVEAGQARVAVRDAGPGLPPKEQTRVWELFHRAPGVTAQGSGGGSMGLGLYICKQIVERHGGQVGVKSVVGEGSTFWFTLPLASVL